MSIGELAIVVMILAEGIVLSLPVCWFDHHLTRSGGRWSRRVGFVIEALAIALPIYIVTAGVIALKTGFTGD